MLCASCCNSFIENCSKCEFSDSVWSNSAGYRQWLQWTPYRQWRPVPWMAVIFSLTHTGLGYLGRDVHLSASHHHSASVLTMAPTFLFSTSQTGTHLISAKLPNPSHLFRAPTCSAGNPQCSEQRKLGSYCQTCTAWKLFESQPSTHTTVWKSLVETQRLTF